MTFFVSNLMTFIRYTYHPKQFCLTFYYTMNNYAKNLNLTGRKKGHLSLDYCKKNNTNDFHDSAFDIINGVMRKKKKFSLALRWKKWGENSFVRCWHLGCYYYIYAWIQKRHSRLRDYYLVHVGEMTPIVLEKELNYIYFFIYFNRSPSSSR